MLEQGKSVKRKEGQRTSVMNQPHPPFPTSLYCSGEEIENLGVNLCLERREGMGRKCFLDFFFPYLSLSHSD